MNLSNKKRFSQSANKISSKKAEFIRVINSLNFSIKEVYTDFIKNKKVENSLINILEKKLDKSNPANLDIVNNLKIYIDLDKKAFDDFFQEAKIIFRRMKIIFNSLKQYLSDNNQIRQINNIISNNFTENNLKIKNTFQTNDPKTTKRTVTPINLKSRKNSIMNSHSESKEKLNEEIGLLAHQIESLGRDMDYYHALSETLSDKKEEAKESEKNLRKMKLTREYLTKAKNRFVAKYMSPVKDRFDYYMDIMANAGILPEDEYQIDAGLSLQKKELGSYHEIAYQSDGYSDMIGICMRFALLDVMFKQEKPMIIMDDPFINLDANHLEGAKEFLKSVAGEYQILYFTCHEDRM